MAVGATLALPGGGDATAPRDLFSACLINGIAAFTLPGVIQVWFTMGETRRANQERERAERDRELLVVAQERARQAESELADTRVQMAELVAIVTDLRRRLDERDNGSGAH